ncbi:MAG TPA: GNAT family protein [Nevskiaceae bacterium]|nr:GNAT family protein [Nevskiaceae bacterium]
MNSGKPTAFVPVTLRGVHVTLEPLSMSHHAALTEAGADPAISRWFPKPVTGAQNMREFIDEAMRMLAEGKSVPFAIRAGADYVGSTRFANIEATHRRAEIGWTWLTPSVQRSAVNSECKYLLLRHAFEEQGCNRVELKTDALNEKSRNAILRIGAKQEGIFRQHMVVQGGRLRDTVYFSIVRDEWPAVKAALEATLNRGSKS